MPIDEITQHMIDRGDITDPELIAQFEASQNSDELADDDEEEEIDVEEEEATEDEDDDEEDEDDDEDGGEGEEEEEDPDEEVEEADEEGDDTDPESEEEDEDGRGNRVPLSRLNQVLAQKDEIAKRNEWLESQIERLIEAKQLPPKDEEIEEEPTIDLVEAEAQYANLLMEGEPEKAAELRVAINQELERQVEARLQTIDERATSAARAEREREAYDTEVENFENKYPFMDSGSDDYNEEAVDTTNALLTGYMASGMSRLEALRKAVKQVAPMYERPVNPQPGKKTVKKKVETRKKNLDVMKKTPPKVRSKVRKDRNLEDIKVADLDDKQFKGLTEREKAVLRGDIVEA